MQTRLPILHETVLSHDLEAQEILPINEEAFTLLANRLSKTDPRRIAQPNLIIGETGSGKTFLIKRLYAEISKNMDNLLCPIQIEGKSLFSTDDLLAQCTSVLDIVGDKDRFDAIMEWQERNKKRLVLLIDNIEYYFERTDNAEQYGLRGKANRNGAPVIVASSKKVLPAFTEYDAAFFDAFKITYIKPLTVSAVQMMPGSYDIYRLERLMAYMPRTIRSLFMAMEVMDKSEDPRNDIKILSDCFSFCYQEKYAAASSQTQRLLSALSLSESGFTLSEIREIIGQENGKISPYLKLISDQKLINKEAKTPRGGIYSIIDPLFRLWLLHNTVPAPINVNDHQ